MITTFNTQEMSTQVVFVKYVASVQRTRRGRRLPQCVSPLYHLLPNDIEIVSKYKERMEVYPSG